MTKTLDHFGAPAGLTIDTLIYCNMEEYDELHNTAV